jgi:peptidoglycan/LPS O-acetylase OafA/YrhL
MSHPDITLTRGIALASPARTKQFADCASVIRADIEALRALAILLVVAFHCRIGGVSGGFMGVDVFYVLSGYLITGLLVTEVERTSRLKLLRFYARRVRRLLPNRWLAYSMTCSISHELPAVCSL